MKIAAQYAFNFILILSFVLLPLPKSYGQAQPNLLKGIVKNYNSYHKKPFSFIEDLKKTHPQKAKEYKKLIDENKINKLPKMTTSGNYLYFHADKKTLVRIEIVSNLKFKVSANGRSTFVNRYGSLSEQKASLEKIFPNKSKSALLPTLIGVFIPQADAALFTVSGILITLAVSAVVTYAATKMINSSKKAEALLLLNDRCKSLKGKSCSALKGLGNSMVNIINDSFSELTDKYGDSGFKAILKQCAWERLNSEVPQQEQTCNKLGDYLKYLVEYLEPDAGGKTCAGYYSALEAIKYEMDNYEPRGVCPSTQLDKLSPEAIPSREGKVQPKASETAN